MTPIASLLAEQFALPPRRRDPDVTIHKGALRLIPDAHCFELSQVRELAVTLADSMVEYHALQPRLAFLPAPVTIIESALDMYRDRTGWMLVQAEDGRSASVFGLRCEEWPGLLWLGELMLEQGAELGGEVLSAARWEQWRQERQQHPGEDWHRAFSRFTGEPLNRLSNPRLKAELYAMLALINTPRIIGRKQHMPEAGLQKKVAFAKGMRAGKFPLHAWTEIRLEVSPPRDAREEAPRETHLTGGKALHFCRAHLRIQNGMLVLVRAHWRGDPALGIKQTRYRLEPPKAPPRC